MTLTVEAAYGTDIRSLEGSPEESLCGNPYKSGSLVGFSTRLVGVNRMPPSPFRPSLVQLNLKRGIGLAEILLWVGYVAGGTTELAQLKVGHFAQACADSFYVFRVGLNQCVLRGGKREGRIAQLGICSDQR